MFSTKELKELQKNFEDLKEEYLKLRKEHWELISQLEVLENKEMEFDRILAKVTKELQEKTKLLTLILLNLGPECKELMDREDRKDEKKRKQEERRNEQSSYKDRKSKD